MRFGPPGETSRTGPSDYLRGSSPGLFLLEFLPALLAALAIAPWVIQFGRADPWGPAMIDLDVYTLAVQALVNGQDLYAVRSPGYQLPFIYPPIAAYLMLPFGLLPKLALQLIWTALGVLALRLVLVRCGVRRGVTVAVLGVVAVLAVEPIRTTLGYGQVNTVLMALVIADLLPQTELTRRRLPRGTLLGLAAAIKLTPLLFVLFLLVLGRRRRQQARVGLTAIVSFAALGLLGLVLQPSGTLTFVKKVLTGDTYGNPVYVGNQSLGAVFARTWPQPSANPTAGGSDQGLGGLVAGAMIALVALYVARRLWHRGEGVLAVGVIGLATCLASPLSWTHHHVWLIPFAIGLVGSSLPRIVRCGGAAWALWNAVCPVLAFLPYGNNIELTYGPAQRLVANLGPLLGSAVLLGAALSLVGRARPRRVVEADDMAHDGTGTTVPERGGAAAASPISPPAGEDATKE